MDVDQVLPDQPAAAGVVTSGPEGGRCGREASSQPATASRPSPVVGRRRDAEPLVLRGALRDGRRAPFPRPRRPPGRARMPARGHELPHRRRDLAASRSMDAGSSAVRMSVSMRSSVARRAEVLGRLVGDRRSAGGGSPRGRGRPRGRRGRWPRCPPQGRRAGGRAGSAASRRPCGPSGRASAACRRRSRSRRRGRARAPASRPPGGSAAPRGGRRGPRRRPTAARMTSIASSSASTDSPGVRRRAAHRGDRVPERAGAQPELGPPAGEDVERRHRPRQHGGRAQRQVEDVGGERDPLGPRRDERQQRPGVQEPRLVRVVLEGDQVEAGPLGEHREGDDAAGVARPTA